MKEIKWSSEKNELLKKNRNISFEQVAEKILIGDVVITLRHPNKDKYPNQKLFVIEFDNYPFIVPFIEEEDFLFLKSIIPDRRYKKYMRN